MRIADPLVLRVATEQTPASLIGRLGNSPGVMLLNLGAAGLKFERCGTSTFRGSDVAMSLVVAWPYRRFRAWGNRCELFEGGRWVRGCDGNPWERLESLWAEYAGGDASEFPFPLGGCFGVWGYGLKNSVEPCLGRRAPMDLGLPDCDVGFYDSVVVFDHGEGGVSIVSTGLAADGSRSAERARRRADEWHELLVLAPCARQVPTPTARNIRAGVLPPTSTFSRDDYLRAVVAAQRYIRSGDIYQVNLAQRLTASAPGNPVGFFEDLTQISPAPHSAYYDAGDYQIASASPELFLRIEGRRVITRPIKGTRPRDSDPVRDGRWRDELRSSPKEQAELLMITDLMRNDLGRVCQYGSVAVPDLMRWEPFAQVQHLVATVEGQLRGEVNHAKALAACFPGGSVTGAPKIRAMEVIDELEPVGRGPYTGALGYLGFNQQSQFSMIIRSAILCQHRIHFPVGAGIVADSDPAAEYDETLAKAGAFLALVAKDAVGQPMGIGER